MKANNIFIRRVYNYEIRESREIEKKKEKVMGLRHKSSELRIRKYASHRAHRETQSSE
jgi:hypothetical protein